MDKVQTFDQTTCARCGYEVAIVESSGGKFVLATDYAVLEATWHEDFDAAIYELAALFPNPRDPRVSDADEITQRKNPADAMCIWKAMIALNRLEAIRHAKKATR